MNQCHCLTLKGLRCKLQGSRVAQNDSIFCWRHQDCQKSIDDNNELLPNQLEEDEDTEILPNQLEEDDDTEILLNQLEEDEDTEILPDQVEEEEDTEILPDQVEEDDDTEILPDQLEDDEDTEILPDQVEDDEDTEILENQVEKEEEEEGAEKEQNWCEQPRLVRAHIVGRLDKRDVDNVCLSSKICLEKVCRDGKLWQGLWNQKFVDKTNQEIDRETYYKYSMNAYGFGENWKLVFNLEKKHDEFLDRFERIGTSIVKVELSDLNGFLLGTNGNLYVTKKDMKKPMVIPNVVDIITSRDSKNYYYVTKNGDFYVVSSRDPKEPEKLLENVQSISANSDIDLIYADGHNYSQTMVNAAVKGLKIKGTGAKTKPRLLYEKTFTLDGKNIGIKNMQAIHPFYVFIDSDDTLYYSKNKLVKLDTNVDIFETGYTLSPKPFIYWTKGNVLYFAEIAPRESTTKRNITETIFAAPIKKIQCPMYTLGLVFVLTTDGNLYVHGKLDNPEDISELELLGPLLPENQYDFTEPALIKSRVEDFVVKEDTLLIVQIDL